MRNLSLDTLTSSATYFSGKWNPSLKRGQTRDVLTLLIQILYGVSHGQLFHANARRSHAAIAESVGLSREWTCKLIARLREARWIRTDARRLPDGTQEITTFRAGRMLKRFLIMLQKSQQKRRVNSPSQKIPTKEQVEKNKASFHQLVLGLAKTLAIGQREERKE